MRVCATTTVSFRPPAQPVQRFLVTLLACLATLGVGCGAERAESPVASIEAYHRAVADRDSDTVYALLDDDARLGMDPETFSVWFHKNHGVVLEQAQDLLTRAREGDVQVRATVDVAQGQTADTTWVDGRWYLASQAPARGAQETPRATLAAFRRALQAKDLADVLRLLSAERRAEYLSELDVLAGALGTGLDNAIVTNGDTAVLPLDNGDKVVLVREDGVWKVHGYEQGGN